MERKHRIADIIVKGYTVALTTDEQRELDNWAAESIENRILLERLQDKNQTMERLQDYYGLQQMAMRPVSRFKRVLNFFKHT